MKRIIKSRIFTFIFGGIILGSIGVYAATQYKAEEILYKNTTVKAALDDLYSKGGTQSESTKIDNFAPTVTSDGNKIKISVESNDKAKGYLYFVDDKVKAVSKNTSEIIEENEAKEYKVYVVAIDEDGNRKKSSEVKILTNGSKIIFNGTEADTAVLGGFNVSFAKSTNYNISSYGKYDNKDSYIVSVANSGNSAIIISKNKININDLSSIDFLVSGRADYTDLNCEIYVGLAENNSVNNSFIKSDKILGLNEFKSKKLNINVLDLSGDYYLKIIVNHPTNVTYYTSYGYLHSITTNKPGIIK